MSWECAIDCDPCDVYEVRDVKEARKNHECAFCECAIKVGMPYKKLFSVWEGEVYTEKWHIECEALMRDAADFICGERTIAFGSTLAGAAKELLAGELSRYTQYDPEIVKLWMLEYGEILEAHDG